MATLIDFACSIEKRGETDTLIVMFHLTAYLLLQIMPKMLAALKIKVGRVK